LLQLDLKPFRLRLIESREGRSETMERTEVTEEVIDLGKASVETKGEALIDQDVGGGRQQFLTGIAQD